MTYREFSLWSKYRNKYGPLDPVRKYDAPSAIIASEINRLRGGKAKPLDFMPYGQKQVDEEVSGEVFVSRLQGMKGVKVGR